MTDPHTLLPLTHVMGWSAAALTLLTFLCQDMRRLRFAALAANAAFIAYASMASAGTAPDSGAGEPVATVAVAAPVAANSRPATAQAPHQPPRDLTRCRLHRRRG
jgi:hypothetical protein